MWQQRNPARRERDRRASSGRTQRKQLFDKGLLQVPDDSLPAWATFFEVPLDPADVNAMRSHLMVPGCGEKTRRRYGFTHSATLGAGRWMSHQQSSQVFRPEQQEIGMQRIAQAVRDGARQYLQPLDFKHTFLLSEPGAGAQLMHLDFDPSELAKPASAGACLVFYNISESPATLGVMVDDCTRTISYQNGLIVPGNTVHWGTANETASNCVRLQLSGVPVGHDGTKLRGSGSIYKQW